MKQADFSMFKAAVKPRQLTDKYMVLAALFDLGATTKPVSARQVNDRIQVFMGKRTPKNINGKLRSYSKDVAPEREGKGLRWRLRDQGVVYLSECSGISLSNDANAVQYNYDIGIVCALTTPELDAVIEAAGGDKAWTEVGTATHAHVYRETTITTNQGKTLRVVATTATSMGLTAAAIATTQLIMLYRPRMVTMIGIAAGLKEGNAEFGDVLVADPSVDYSSGKVVEKNGISDFLPDPYPLELLPRLRAVLKNFARRSDVFEEIRNRWPGDLPKRANTLRLGAISATDQVVDATKRVQEMTTHWRKLIGIEMETYGVYRAASEAPDPRPKYVSFKAVCDFASQKGDAWQPYAAYMAANFSFEFFKREWTSLWPSS